MFTLRHARRAPTSNDAIGKAVTLSAAGSALRQGRRPRILCWMRLRFRGAVVALSSLLLAVACIGGADQCLNPQPDLPSCGGKSAPRATGGTSSAAGAGHGTPSAAGGAASGIDGSGNNIGNSGGGPASGETAGSSGDFDGAGGDRALDPGAPEAGAAGVAGAAGAAGSLDNGP